MKTVFSFAFALLLGMTASARSHQRTFRHHKNVEKKELLVKWTSPEGPSASERESWLAMGVEIQDVAPSWILIRNLSPAAANALRENPAVMVVQKNYSLRLLQDYSLQDPLRRAALGRWVARHGETRPAPLLEKPELPNIAQQMNTGLLVAVLDTGLDYERPEISRHLWVNEKETPDNQIDDDNNGYVDDVAGWDFVAKDNKAYDLSSPPLDVLLQGGNPGHGTRCAENILAPLASASAIRLMPLRVLSNKGEGRTADLVQALHYAVDNGARIIHLGWKLDEPENAAANLALQEALDYAREKGALVVAPAGDGEKGLGFDNDESDEAVYPASYPMENILSVAALNSHRQLSTFANWGAQSVDLAAPASPSPLADMSPDPVLREFGMSIGWDGSDQASAHVAGVLAREWAAHPEKSALAVKSDLLASTRKLDSLANKCLSGGALDF